MAEYVWNSLALAPATSLAVRVFVNALVMRKNPKWIVSKIFFVLTMTVIVWDFGEIMLTLTSPAYAGSTGAFWARVEWMGVPLTTALTLQFGLACSRFYSKRPSLRFWDVLFYLPAIPFIALIVGTGDIVSGVVASEPWRPYALRSDSTWSVAFTTYYTALGLLTLVLLFWARRNAKDARSRTQLTWFFVAFLIPVLYVATIGRLLVAYPGMPGINYVTYSATLGVSAVCLAYAIVRYQLFDIKVQIYIRSGLIVGVSFLVAVAFTGAVVFVLLLAAGGTLLSDPIVLPAVLVVAVLLYRRWERVATRIVETLSPSLKWKEAKIGDVYLVTRSGLLVTRVAGQSAMNADEDLMVGMLTVIQNFLDTSFGLPFRDAKGDLNVLSYGNMKLLIEHGELCYMVVVFDGFEIDEMRPHIRKTLDEIHVRYSDALDTWDGTPDLGDTINPMICDMLGIGTAA